MSEQLVTITNWLKGDESLGKSVDVVTSSTLQPMSRAVHQRKQLEEVSMKAVVFHDVGDIRLDEVAEPKIEQATDAIVRLTASAICGTDLHMVRGTMQRPSHLIDSFRIVTFGFRGNAIRGNNDLKVSEIGVVRGK
jgi:hypothetical protein